MINALKGISQLQQIEKSLMVFQIYVNINFSVNVHIKFDQLVIK